MMKKITLLLLLLISFTGFSQQETFDVTFETGTDGNTASNWSTFENDSNPSIEVVANPDATGINTSATVAKFTALDAGKPWAGTQTDHLALGEWILESGNNTISIMVYKTVISDVGIKFVTSTNGTLFELKQANTTINAWEKLTYDISSFITHGENHNLDRLVVFPDWPADRTSDNIVYFDNITWDAKRTADASGGGGGGGSSAPTTAPTAPTAAAVDVISLFSDEYTDLAATWNPAWGQSTVVEDETIAGNPLKKYSNFTFSGVEPTGGTIDASSMTYVNIDYWTSDATELKIKLVDYNGDGAWGSDNTEVEITKSITKDSWGTVSIALSEFTTANAAISFNDIGQLVLSATGATNPVYLDNFYFSKDSGGSTAPTTAPTAPTAASADVISLFSDEYTDLAATWNPAWGQSTVVEDETIAGNPLKKYSNFTFSGVEPTGGTIDASSMTYVNIDYWTSDATELKIKLVDYNGDGAWGSDNTEVEITKSITKDSWGTVSIALSEFTTANAAISFNDIGQLVLSATGATNPVYLDNFYFSKPSSGGGGGSTVALPIDFESATTWGDFDGGAVTTIANPQSNTDNNSANVGQMVKSAGQTWGGSSLTLSSAMDFANNDTFTMKVYSPRVGAKVLLKVENSGNGGINFEKEVSTTIANGWETLTFNYAAINTANSYDKLVIIFDLGTMGDGSANFTFYIDDVVLSKVSSGGTQMDLPVTFEDPAVEYGVIGFGDAISTLDTNPDATGNNTSTNVVKVVKIVSAATWAGTTVTAAAELGFKTLIPFSVTDTKMTVAVWSPDAGIQVRLKAEDHADVTHTVETEATTTVAAGWEVLEFDFSNQAAGTESLSHGLNNGWVYDKVSIFFNFGVDGPTAGEKTYYFDNVAFGSLASLGVDDVNLVTVKVYPNPTKDILNIASQLTIKKLSIYTVLGKEVKRIEMNKKSQSIDVSELNSGIYFVRYSIGNSMFYHKFIKD